MHERLILEIKQATEAVLCGMLAIEAAAGEPTADSPGPGPIGGVSSMVGMVGEWIGAGAVSCEKEMACRLASVMLMSEFTEVNEDVLDAMGEIANMVIGNIKTNLEETLGPMQLGIPTVTYGANFATRSMVKETWTMVPFHCNGDLFYVQVLLTETSRLSNAGRIQRVLTVAGVGR
jgi:chemotaxis protein CheX